jgi:hypothetical protein
MMALVKRWPVMLSLLAAFVPSSKSVVVAAAGVGGFVASGTVAAGICYVLLRWYSSTLPVATEAYEGFGDAVTLVVLESLGLLFSIVA